MSKKDKPTAAKVGQMRAWLAQHGVPPQTANSLVRTTKTLEQIGNDMAGWLKDRPKKVGK